MTDISTEQLRKAFSAFPSGVTIVTTSTAEKQPIGFTASSFTSVSIEPPLLLVCIDHRSENIDMFRQSNYFGVNVLAADQGQISCDFAAEVEDRFACVDWYMSANDTPMIRSSLSRFDCSLHDIHAAGDHDILIGRVIDLETDEGDALGYFRGRYVQFNQG
jgi:flavin reductase (DIM6/NTAB) family NADH-FMN oxidoreductase RutF